MFEDLLYQTILPAGAQSSEQTTFTLRITTGTGVRPVATERLHSQGNSSQTNNSKDVAIKGQGFFQVMLPDGSSAYTRDGSFQGSERAAGDGWWFSGAASDHHSGECVKYHHRS